MGEGPALGEWPPVAAGALLGEKPPPLDGDGPPTGEADGIDVRAAGGALEGAFDDAGAVAGADCPGDWPKPWDCGEGGGAGLGSGTARCWGCSVGGAA